MRAINYPLSSRVRSSPREIFNLPYSVFSGDCKKKMGLGQIFSAVEGWRACPLRPSATVPDVQSLPCAAAADPKAIARRTPPLLSASRLPVRPPPPLGVSRCLSIQSGRPARHNSLLPNPYSVSPSPGRPSLQACRVHQPRGMPSARRRAVSGGAHPGCPAGRVARFSGEFLLDSAVICAKVRHNLAALQSRAPQESLVNGEPGGAICWRSADPMHVAPADPDEPPGARCQGCMRSTGGC